MKKIIIAYIILAVCLINFVFIPKVLAVDYSLAWPGILPDNRLYKLKVLRNKIIYKMIINPVKKVEFDLLMADKTIYASKLLMEKGKVDLSKETALKGENYYSMLVQDYNKALLSHKQIPLWLDGKITLAAIKHQKVFKQLGDTVTGENKKTFQIVSKFSKINYDFIVGLRNPK
ncbi:MAG: DUF5667 domain-containing protein [Candidatus Parcubacteria bacterium]|nr:DUF5667 domain-containing protein [Candidatus Parcubacteria bacterium]